jgi:hypothetical protein
MAIKFWILLLISLTTFAESKLISCREHRDIKVLNSYVEHLFNAEGTEKIGEKIVSGELARDWSNLSAHLKEIFYKYSDEKYRADNVKIIYTVKGSTKPLYMKTSKLKEIGKGFYKINDYTFNDGVKDKVFRPAAQTYVFRNGKKPICSITVFHYHAEEF